MAHERYRQTDGRVTANSNRSSRSLKTVYVHAAAYHCKCIDTWLVQDSDLCPLCKKSVIDDEDSERDDAAAASGSASQSAAAAGNVNDAEDAPLLHRAGRHRPRRYGSSRVRGSSPSLHIVDCVPPPPF